LFYGIIFSIADISACLFDLFAEGLCCLLCSFDDIFALVFSILEYFLCFTVLTFCSKKICGNCSESHSGNKANNCKKIHDIDDYNELKYKL
jgi:hypothetical protein